MEDSKRQVLAGLLASLVPPDGAAIGNQSLRESFLEAAKAAGHKNTGSALEVAFESLREELLQKGVLAKGKGRGGSVRRAQAEDAATFVLGAVVASTEADPASTVRAKPGAQNKKVAVNIVDDRGIESVKVIALDATISDSERRPGGSTP